MHIDRIPGREKQRTASEIVKQEAPEDQRMDTPSRWIDINSALPNLILGFCYALAAFWSITLPLMDKHWLGTMMAIEFLVIHSFPFMMLIGSATPTTDKEEKWRRTWFWGLFGIYFIFAAKMGGLPGVITFGSLTVATYLGYLLRRTSPGAVGQLVLRWVMSFLAFMITSSAAGMPENVDDWPGHARVLYYGMSYFLVLGFLELSEFYHWPSVLILIKKFQEQWKRDRHS